MKNKINTPTQFAMPAVKTDFDIWVLKSAAKMGIKRLYFLARDGFIMYNAARIIVEKNNIDTENCGICIATFVGLTPTAVRVLALPTEYVSQY